MFSQKKREKIKKSHKKQPCLNNKGFTLLEIVLVIFIVSVVFVAIYALFSKTIKNDTEHSLEVIAANLAQEGVEIIRNKRDNNILNDDTMDAGIVTSSDKCYPYIDASGDPKCDTSRKADIKKESGTYKNCVVSPCSTGRETRFRRTCEVVKSGSPVEVMEVECTVEWRSMAAKNMIRSITVDSYLTDWQDPN